MGGILDAILLNRSEDRHFASLDSVRAQEIESAERTWRRAADAAKAEYDEVVCVEIDGPKVKAMWANLAAEIGARDLVVLDLQPRVVEARGAVSPEEHRRRIFALRNTLDDEDEQTGFETRSRIMAAVHELVAAMAFLPDPLVVTVTTGARVSTDVNW